RRLAGLSVHPGEKPVQSRTVEDCAIRLQRVVPGREDDEPGDEEGRERRREWGGNPARRLPHREALGDSRLCRQVRLRGLRLIAHAGTSSLLRPPPVMASPSSSSLASGVYSPTSSPS